jgi:catechol 2,3-dioxygenase-like lactoylglutathione lyase family enzyme
MLTAIDHAVILVADLDRGVEAYRRLGFSVVPGGRHAAGTHNALVGLADGSYLELIAFREPAPSHRWWPALQQGEGLVDFCAATDDLPGDSERLRRAGVAMTDPRPMSRVRPDGVELRWVVATPPAELAGVVPFLIQDQTRRQDRVPREVTHANAVVGLVGVDVAVPAVASIARIYAAVLGARAVPDGDGTAREIRLAAHAVRLLPPSDAGAAGRLAARGPGPCALVLAGERVPPEAWPPAVTCGVPVRVRRR